MNLNQAKDKFYELVSMFFTKADIRWAEAVGTKPKPPYLTLKAGPMRKTAFPREDESGNTVYDCSTTMEVNLYTKGAPVTVDGKATANYENTAISDLTDFSLFLESEAIVDKIAGWGMDISQLETIRDLTALENDTAYRYRAMAEFTINYAQAANGLYGTQNMPYVPNSSGGGTVEMQQAEIDAVDEVEIEFDTNEH